MQVHEVMPGALLALAVICWSCLSRQQLLRVVRLAAVLSAALCLVGEAVVRWT